MQTVNIIVKFFQRDVETVLLATSVPVSVFAEEAEGMDASPTSFELKLNTGAVEGKTAEEFAADITVHGKIAEGTEFSKTLQELGADVTYTPGGADKDSTTAEIKNLPYFTLDGEEIIYWLTMEDRSAEQDTKDANDQYVVTYDNALSDNFGSVQDKCHKGGKLIITFVGSAPYEATKNWLDDGKPETIAKRPEAKLHLWRYSNRNGANYTTAAMVKDPREDHTGNISWTLDRTKNEEIINTDQIALAGLEK